MKIGLISDIHGNYAALEQVIRELKSEGVDIIMNAGDNAGYSSGHEDCVKMLIDENIPGCMGNYDEAVGFDRPICGCGESDDEALMKMRAASLKWARENASPKTKKYLSLLPQKLEIAVGNTRILAIHGGLDTLNEMIGKDEDDKMEVIAGRNSAEIVVMGHTHTPFFKKISGKIFVNPGSVGRPIDNDPRASYGLVKINGDIQVELRRTAYDVEGNIRALTAAGLPAEIGVALRNGREI
jgi:putative phosphoesterase